MSTEDLTTEPGAADLGDFTHLAAEAASLEGGPPVPGTPAAVAAEAESEAMQIEANAELIEFGWGIVSPLIPERYAERYGEKERTRIAEAYTRLAIKRGWDIGEFLGQWGAEIALVVAVAGPVLPVVMQELKERGEAKRKPAKEVADVSDSQATH
jgi:hypothetical protein